MNKSESDYSSERSSGLESGDLSSEEIPAKGKCAYNENSEESNNINEITAKVANWKSELSDSSSSSEEETVPKIRYFSLVDASGNNVGRYTGATPKQAASKAFTTMIRKQKEEDKLTPQTICIRESTQGANYKTYMFEAGREKLFEPQTLEIIDKVSGTKKVISYQYKNWVRKARKNTEDKKEKIENEGRKIMLNGHAELNRDGFTQIFIEEEESRINMKEIITTSVIITIHTDLDIPEKGQCQPKCKKTYSKSYASCNGFTTRKIFGLINDIHYNYVDEYKYLLNCDDDIMSDTVITGFKIIGNDIYVL